jgi:hypothetical protein
VRVKKEKQPELFSEEEDQQQQLQHTFLVKALAQDLEVIADEKTENPKKKSATVTSIIQKGKLSTPITMSSSMPPPRTQSTPVAAQSTNAIPLKSILKSEKTKVDEPKAQRSSIDDFDDERPTTWNGIFHYLPVIFGCVIIFLLSKSQKIDYETAKLLWASFMVGLGAMFVQLKMIAPR